MYRLINPVVDARVIIAEMGESGNPAYVFALVELLRFNYWVEECNQALERLTGQRPGDDWFAWARWLWQQDNLSPPLLFAGWKGKFIRSVSGTNYKYLLPNALVSKIEVEEIVWSGLSWGDIPPLDHPGSVAASMATHLQEDERVLGASIDGESRAYPVRILEHHQVVNDTLGGKPVVVTYCPLAGAGIMYQRPVVDKEFLFRASGLIYRNNTLIYDQSATLWSQFTGERVARRAIDSDMSMEPLPVVLTTWAAWRAMHPDTTVLEMPTGYFREYDPGWIYGEYIASPEVGFPLPTDDDRLEDKEQVFGLIYGGTARVYRLQHLLANPVLNDAADGLEVILILDSADGVRAYRRGGHIFRPAESPNARETLVNDESGQTWRVEEEALVNLSDPAQRLERLPGRLAYWFAWYSFYPDMEFYGEGGPS